MPTPPGNDNEDPVMLAGINLLGHTGAQSFQLRWSDDEQPVVWMAVATYERDGKDVHEAAGGLTPRLAVYRLCELLMDGGTCTHCHRPTGVSDDFAGDQPLDFAICWYVYDPELRKFRRSCEGTDTRPCKYVSGPGQSACGYVAVVHVPQLIDHEYVPDKRIRKD